MTAGPIIRQVARATMTPSESFSERQRFVALVDALPHPEGYVILARWWRDESYGQIAAACDWILPDGSPDRKKAQRAEQRAMDRLKELAAIIELDLERATCE